MDLPFALVEVDAALVGDAVALDETLLDGYTFVNITGDTECPLVLGGTVTLDEGQDITCTIKLTNPSNTLPVPPLKGTILFIGQDRRTPQLFEILSTQPVEASIDPGKTFEKKMEPFTTTYDSERASCPGGRAATKKWVS